MCTRPIYLNRPASVRDRYLQSFKSGLNDIVGCGKCPECLSKRQNAVTIRSYEMSKKLGNVNFLTLTYKEDMLPISLSIWRKLSDGRKICIGKPRILQPEFKWSDVIANGVLTKTKTYSKSFHTLQKSVVSLPYQKRPLSDARVLDFRPDYLDGFPDDVYLRLTPCHDVSHVQKLIKRCRMRWERAFGHVEWKYICVSEFGIKNTRRPHYHLLFFGCPDGLVRMIEQGWQNGMYRDLKPFETEFGVTQRRIELNPSYGDAKTEKVIAKNADDKDYNGYEAVAAYLGKYVSKGKYDTNAVKQGLVYVPRLIISHGLGKLLPADIDFYLCKDKYNYDLARPETYPAGLVEDVISRLQYKLPNGKYALSLPTYYTDQIFGRRCFKSRFEVRKVYPSLLQTALSFDKWPSSGKAFYAPLYYEVSACLRNKYILDNQAEFEQYKANHPSTPLFALADEFEKRRKAYLENREKAEYERLLRRLLKSKY